MQKYINIYIRRGQVIQEIEFPEDYTLYRRLVWGIACLILPVKIRWFE